MEAHMLSVIIPVYRSEETLERCVKSILGQTYQNLEIIMIVDGPPDASGLLADRLAKEDQRINVIHQENQGVSAARNTGIKNAKGDYIQFVDSDDYLEASACESMVEMLEREETDMVIAGFTHWYFGKRVEKVPKQLGSYVLRDSKNIFLEIYEQQYLNMPWNKLFKKKFITEGFQNNLSLGEDLLFNINYMKNITSFSILSSIVYHYIQDDRGTTLSTKIRNDRIQIAFTLLEEMRRFCKQIYGMRESGGVLENKVLVEFLDETEQSVFLNNVSSKTKKDLIKTYEDAWTVIVETYQGKIPVRLKLLDYRIIYPFFVKKQTGMVYLLVLIRKYFVKLLRKGK